MKIIRTTKDGRQKAISSDSFFAELMDEAKNQDKRLPCNLIPDAMKTDAPRFTLYRVKGDHHVIVATSPADFLHRLRTGSRFDSEGTDTEYMVRFARRLQELEGYLVSTDSPEAFLTDLISHGFVSVE